MYRRPASIPKTNAPFKPPRFVSPVGAKNTDIKIVQRISHTTDPNDLSCKRPLENEQNTKLTHPVLKKSREAVSAPVSNSSINESKYYLVLWRKKTMKKNKTWDGDGIGILSNNCFTFKCDLKGGKNYKELGKTTKVQLDAIMSLGSYEIEVDCELTDPIELAKAIAKCSSKAVQESTDDEGSQIDENSENPVDQSRTLTNTKFKMVIDKSLYPVTKARVPLYEANTPNALVMKRPTNISSNQIVDVVVDPALSKFLRPHQREGVEFLYECVMGLRSFKGNGALLADEMGLGKTLMTISVIWTLLRQNPIGGNTSSVIKKVLITCPVTLVGNWKKEFKKWLNMNRIGVLAINGKQSAAKDKSDIVSFGKTRVYQVLIMGYEKLLSTKTELAETKFDLLICDEGHRLKNSQNKVLKALNDLQIKKKILLTGTPIQNDLTEFYNIINFINPNILGSMNSFTREFVRPILRSREVNCINEDVIKMGDEKSKELIKLTHEFILRRTSSIISNYLPPKTDLVLFCKPTGLQVSLFKLVSKSRAFHKVVESDNKSDCLSLITMFKKVCNSPSLLANDKLFNSLKGDEFDFDISRKRLSGKISVIIPLLLEIKQLAEKVVLISNYTQTLDLLQEIISSLNLSFCRLDGSTPNNKRDGIVAQFNNSSFLVNSVFLLSAKSGGCGLNLIGASRLILFDNDWNPSVDLQAMARIHRDGQKKPVFIYRLLTTGCIDEKIFQRQMMKSNLSDKFLDNKQESKDDLFDMTDLKDLFTINSETKSNTHDLLECRCEGIGEDTEILSTTQETADASSSDLQSKKFGWISALNFKDVCKEDKGRKKGSISGSLVGYRHFDPIKHNADIYCGDDVIDNMVKKFQSDGNIPLSFMLTKMSEKGL